MLETYFTVISSMRPSIVRSAMLHTVKTTGFEKTSLTTTMDSFGTIRSAVVVPKATSEGSKTNDPRTNNEFANRPLLPRDFGGKKRPKEGSLPLGQE